MGVGGEETRPAGFTGGTEWLREGKGGEEGGGEM